MSSVGIIANPASGRDIRRLVARGAVFSNHEKVNIVQRVLLGLAAVGVDQVWVMPDSFSICQRALAGLDGQASFPFPVSTVDMAMTGRQEDSATAAALMAEAGVACIITLGGDGTNRMVAKRCGEVPLLPISTGTNNVFPSMVEGTTAGLAAGAVARGWVALDRVARRSKRADISRNGELIDLALVDATGYDALFTGTRALWEVRKVRWVFLTWCEPGNIGMSSIGAALRPVAFREPRGLMVWIGPGGTTVRAPIAPGMVEDVGVVSYHLLAPGQLVPVEADCGVIAVDGEREIQVAPQDRIELSLSLEGPRVIDCKKVLAAATAAGHFQQDPREPPAG